MGEIESGSPDEDVASYTLADKLNKLFDTMRRPNEAPLSNQAAAEAIKKKTGVSISTAYLWQLRNGMKDNPTLQHLQAIADMFGVPPSYLVDPGGDPKIDSQLNLIQAMRDGGVRNLALRASGLTPRSLNNVAAILDHARELEHLPPVEESSTDGGEAG